MGFEPLSGQDVVHKTSDKRGTGKRERLLSSSGLIMADDDNDDASL